MPYLFPFSLSADTLSRAPLPRKQAPGDSFEVFTTETIKITSKPEQTRSTQRAQTSLAEADHYSHIAHCKNVEPWL